ncbi:transglutaminase family protein [Bifidobacterium pseudolongum]|uniref:transglutaminase family protein n=1 Tax=Bifidobacterium pseudolongum TaxID=1694 RepID=UPI001021B470|nr:transglutaminase family protein [Bifidobacterium pseudolongum]RYQ02837.1 transglutaminase [Bifidobacterium pseudolongum subsp. globosum]RYQ06298.1 transglutaminase [Bifidobacterium pseudolongum subsp. globosum]RYQ13092.1 transglutaminase [Bifidobacterium pseudolongum subsp. globosum]
MKKLIFAYEMKLTFSAPVTEHRFQLRCVPVTGPRQQVIDVNVRMEPHVDLESTIDSFGSRVMTGYIPQEHTSFGYLVTGIAFVDNANIKEEPFKPLYRFQSELTKPGAAIGTLVEQCRTRLAALGFDAGELESAQAIMDEVYGAFEYTPGSTTVQTNAEEAFAQRRGVCQDYAHVMLSACRELGIPCRYIAGLLDGEGATHAWVEVYHDRRWIGLDPTHNRMVDDNYITIAHGRDYRDCMLDIGVFSGERVSQTQWVNASVHESLV